MSVRFVVYSILLFTCNIDASYASLTDIDLKYNLLAKYNLVEPPTPVHTLLPSIDPDDHNVLVQLTVLDPFSKVVGSLITRLDPAEYALVWTTIPNPQENNLLSYSKIGNSSKLPPDATCVWDMDSAGKIQFKSVMPPLKSPSLFWRFLCCCCPCLDSGEILTEGRDEEK